MGAYKGKAKGEGGVRVQGEGVQQEGTRGTQYTRQQRGTCRWHWVGQQGKGRGRGARAWGKGRQNATQRWGRWGTRHRGRTHNGTRG